MKPLVAPLLPLLAASLLLLAPAESRADMCGNQGHGGYGGAGGAAAGAGGSAGAAGAAGAAGGDGGVASLNARKPYRAGFGFLMAAALATGWLGFRRKSDQTMDANEE